VAALAVLFYHYTGRQSDQWGADVQSLFPLLSRFTVYGYLGVELFFLISGFVIFMSFDGRSIRSFVASRVARLYPAYWAAIILTSALLIWIAPQLGRSLSVTQIGINLTMLQTPLRVDHVDGVYWTLWVELVFYLFIVIVMAMNLGDNFVTLCIFLWPIFGLVVTLLAPTFVSSGLGARYAAFFAAGMSLYLIHKHGHRVILWLAFAVNAIMGTYLVTLNSTETSVADRLDKIVVAAVLLICFGLVALATVTPWRARGAKWMTIAGALTYPLYLIHQYWGWWIIGLLAPIGGRWVALAGAILVVILLAFAIERWVERPLRPRIRRLLLRRRRGRLCE